MKMFIKFWGSKRDGGTQRMISAKRIKGRRVKVSKWAREAQRCDEAMAKIDKELLNLSGRFTRARKELLEAQRLVWQGKLSTALSHMKKQKTLLVKNVGQNVSLVTKRTS